MYVRAEISHQLSDLNRGTTNDFWSKFKRVKVHVDTNDFPVSLEVRVTLLLG